MKYVFLTPAIGGVGGAQIYCRNKINYCKKNKMQVYLFYDKKREIIIDDLRFYEAGLLKELSYFPQYYSNNKRQQIIHKVLEVIKFNGTENILIESHAPAESMWGELIAQKCNGRNMVFLLPETFEGLDEQSLAFFKFKYIRRELACINKKVMQRLFQTYMPLKLEECFELNAECTNSVEDVEIPTKCNINGNKKVIGIIGRLQKPYVEIAVREIAKLLEKHSVEEFQVVIIGGSDNKKDEKRLKKILQRYKNVELYITGIVYPIPQKLIRKMDVCIGAAGCVSVSRRENIPTISVDSVLGKAMGVVGYNTLDTIASTNQNSLKSIEYYLENILYGDFLHKYDVIPLLELDTEELDSIFRVHMEFIKNFEEKKQYYDCEHIKFNNKNVVKKILGSLGGIYGINLGISIIRVWNSIKKMLEKITDYGERTI